MATQTLDNPTPATATTAEERQLAGLMAEFDNVDSVMAAARVIRDRGFSRWDVHSPFPIHGIDEAMGTRRTMLPWIVLVCGLTGLLAGLGLELFTNSFDYKFLISGKPFLSIPAFIPVVFETTVLLSAFGAVFGMLGLNKLPMLYHPLFNSERFRRVTNDRFFVVIDSSDPKFDETRTAELLRTLQPVALERVED